MISHYSTQNALHKDITQPLVIPSLASKLAIEL